LAIARLSRQASVHRPAPPASPESSETDHLKQVSRQRSVRQQIRNRAIEVASRLDKSQPLAKHQIEIHSRTILQQMGRPEGHLGWTMVILGSAFWREQVVSVPYDRRLLLLPHCLRDAEACSAGYNELGLQCQDCGACRLRELRALAVRLGYHVLIAEGSPIVMQIILAGHVDAVLGVACLNSLEKALDKILLVGLPSMAVPLHAATCRDTSTDEDWVREMIETPYRPGTVQTQTHVHLLRCAAGMFEPRELARLVPRRRSGPSLAETNGEGLAGLDPVASTETIAHDFLQRGGKHFRPFITLAAYDAMTGGHGSGADGAANVASFPDAVKRIALAIEVFHKASLVHDDIEDDDQFRYGRPALHRKYGTPVAINVGDYLIGLGYRLVAAQRKGLAADVVGDVLAKLSEAHTSLCEGQGAELAWRHTQPRHLEPREALWIYALKTAPAFEVALYAGLRLAGGAEQYGDLTVRFARHLGVAYQILNDLRDWQNHQPNKLATATDVLAGRPTVLWALALEALNSSDRRELESLVADSPLDEATVRGVRRLYDRADVFRKAGALVEKHRRRAQSIADTLKPDRLGRLLHNLADTIIR